MYATLESLALSYVDADELLYAFLVLLFCGAAAGVLTWLTKRTLGFSHLLVHPRQTEPTETQEGARKLGWPTFVEIKIKGAVMSIQTNSQ